MREELLVSIHKKSLKACHLLKKLQDESAPAVMIQQLVHLRAKDTVYSLRKNLSEYRQPLNGKPVFIQERLPYHDAEIKKTADNINLITKIDNCQVKVLVNQGDRKAFIQINDLK